MFPQAARESYLFSSKSDENTTAKCFWRILVKLSDNLLPEHQDQLHLEIEFQCYSNSKVIVYSISIVIVLL